MIDRVLFSSIAEVSDMRLHYGNRWGKFDSRLFACFRFFFHVKSLRIRLVPPRGYI